MARVPRRTARVMPVSPLGEVLLLQGRDPARPDDLHWVAIGGAVEPDESVVDAALRELREETGIVVPAERLEGPIHRREHEFSWNGVDYRSDSTFFAMALHRETEVTFAHLEPAEVGNLLQAAWWTPEALAADGTAAGPDIPQIMTAAVAAVRGTT